MSRAHRGYAEKECSICRGHLERAMGAHNEDSTHKIVGCTMYCLIFAKRLDWPSRSFSSIGDGVFSLVRGESASRGRPKLKIPQDMSRGGDVSITKRKFAGLAVE